MVATFAFVIAVVATPRESLWAYAVYAVLLGAVARFAEIPWSYMAKRLVLETPFVLFALLLPFFGSGEQTEFLGLTVSIEGLWAAWNILIKASLGLLTTVLLAATTSTAEILRGMERLHVPRVITAIAGFMIRYAEVIGGEMRRMRIARESRGYDPRWFWQVRGLAATAGTLFVRSFERGERVYLAMLSRGFDGTLPRASMSATPSRDWVSVLWFPAFAVIIATTAWYLR